MSKKVNKSVAPVPPDDQETKVQMRTLDDTAARAARAKARAKEKATKVAAEKAAADAAAAAAAAAKEAKKAEVTQLPLEELRALMKDKSRKISDLLVQRDALDEALRREHQRYAEYSQAFELQQPAYECSSCQRGLNKEDVYYDNKGNSFCYKHINHLPPKEQPSEAPIAKKKKDRSAMKMASRDSIDTDYFLLVKPGIAAFIMGAGMCLYHTVKLEVKKGYYYLLCRDSDLSLKERSALLKAHCGNPLDPLRPHHIVAMVYIGEPLSKTSQKTQEQVQWFTGFETCTLHYPITVIANYLKEGDYFTGDGIDCTGIVTHYSFGQLKPEYMDKIEAYVATIQKAADDAHAANEEDGDDDDDVAPEPTAVNPLSSTPSPAPAKAAPAKAPAEPAATAPKAKATKTVAKPVPAPVEEGAEEENGGEVEEVEEKAAEGEGDAEGDAEGDGEGDAEGDVEEE